jgi:plasmid stabilization system protein ParE
MAQVTYSARALGALEHAVKPPAADTGSAAAAALAAIESAVNTLAAHPLVGRRVDSDLRELVISFGETGFIALYRFVVQGDAVRVLALRRQSEIGYMP